MCIYLKYNLERKEINYALSEGVIGIDKTTSSSFQLNPTQTKGGYNILLIDMYSEKYERIWTRRFIGATIIQGAIIVGLTVFLVLIQIPVLKPEVSRVDFC